MLHHRNNDNNYPSENPEEWGYGICHNPISPDEMPVSKYNGLMEAIEICRRAKVPTQISHLTQPYIIHEHYPEFLQEAAAKATLEIINKARTEGLDLTFDVMPEGDVTGALMSTPRLISLFNTGYSKWIKKFGSEERFVEALRLPDFRAELKKEIMGGKFKIIMIHPKTDPYWMERPVIMICKNNDYIGKTIGQIARQKNIDPMDAIFDIITEDPDTRFNNNDPRWTDTTQRVLMQHPLAMPATDLIMVPFQAKIAGGGGLPAGEPGWATYALFPSYIRKYARDRNVFSLEEAIKRITHLQARRLGLTDRGVIASGAYADIVLIDFKKLRETGTWLKPKQAPEGITHVMVNGKVVYEKMTHTGAKPGKALRHKTPIGGMGVNN